MCSSNFVGHSGILPGFSTERLLTLATTVHIWLGPLGKHGATPFNMAEVIFPCSVAIRGPLDLQMYSKFQYQHFRFEIFTSESCADD
jgi:hypothetical protein